jgi:hypothetical protein
MKHDIAFSEEIRRCAADLDGCRALNLDAALVSLPLDVGVESPQCRGNL